MRLRPPSGNRGDVAFSRPLVASGIFHFFGKVPAIGVNPLA